MKKLFVAVLAVAALASCAQEDVILNNDKAITFGDAYVANSTKAIYEGTNYVQAFQVWGTVTPAGDTESVILYNGANVTRPAGLTGYNPATAWECTVQRFWTPNCNYAFYAVVDAKTVNATGGVPTSIEYEAVATGDKDLLYGATTKEVGADASNPGLVAFTMQHLLSKITFKVINPAENGDYSYNVKTITVSGAYASGTYTFADTAKANANDGVWAGEGTMSALSFAGTPTTTPLASGATHTPTEAYVIIPGEPKLTITIVTETVFGGKVVSPAQTHTLTVNTTDSAEDDDTDIAFAKNTHYNFAVTLPEPGKPIQFTIEEVDGFPTPGADTTIQ